MDLRQELTRSLCRATRRLPLIEQPGLIAVVSGDRTTYPQFSICLSAVMTSVISSAQGDSCLAAGTDLDFRFSSGAGIAAARSEAAELALAKGFGWIWFIDDDHTLTADVLIRLLRHNRDIVTPLVLQRQPPHRPVVWEPWPIGADASDADLVDGCLTSRRLVGAGRGLVEIGHGGTGGMLISARVLETLDAPHFEFGRLRGDLSGEDTWFCCKARRAGFKIWCDLDTPIGHLATVAVWPKRDQRGDIEPSYHFTNDIDLSPTMRERLGYKPEAG